MQQPVVAADYSNELGEGCLWHPEHQCVYWLDIAPGRLHRHHPATGENAAFDLGAPTGGFTIQADGALLLFMAEGAIRTWRDGRFLSTIVKDLPQERGNRFNDVIADPQGRVFCGVMSTTQRPGRLYRLDLDGTLQVVIPQTGVSNGMGFTGDTNFFFHTDTPTGNITRYHYDPGNGAIENPTAFVHAPRQGDGGPDGMTVDSEDHIWSARWNDSCIVRYDLSGHEVERVHFPARKITSLTFGGADYRDCFVTSAGGHHRAEEGDGAGALFHLRLDVPGRPEFRSRIGL